MPTEEVFTAPDARRVDGTVRATYPLQIQGTIVRGLEVRFEDGRAVDVRADEGEELMRTHVATDDGAARLGEVALVDGNSRVGRTGIVFYDTLFDENAASHIALGTAILQAVDGARRDSPPSERHERGVNQSVDPHRLHDRLARARDPRRHDGRRRGRRSSATATGSCSTSRGGQTRTAGFRVPNAALYQAELRPVGQCSRSAESP